MHLPDIGILVVVGDDDDDGGGETNWNIVLIYLHMDQGNFVVPIGCPGRFLEMKTRRKFIQYWGALFRHLMTRELSLY